MMYVLGTRRLDLRLAHPDVMCESGWHDLLGVLDRSGCRQLHRLWHRDYLVGRIDVPSLGPFFWRRSVLRRAFRRARVYPLANDCDRLWREGRVIGELAIAWIGKPWRHGLRFSHH